MSFYESVIFSIDELISDLKVDLEVPFQGQGSILYSVANFSQVCGQAIYRPTEYYFNGRCYSLLLPDCILDRGILEMRIRFKQQGNILADCVDACMFSIFWHS